MRTPQVLLFLAAASIASFCFPGGVLENVRKIRVDPTVIEQREKVRDPIAAELVRYNLRAAVRDALLEEGESPIRAHIVPDPRKADLIFLISANPYLGDYVTRDHRTKGLSGSTSRTSMWSTRAPEKACGAIPDSGGACSSPKPPRT